MEIARLGEVIYQSFTVTDETDALVTGLTDGDFTRHLYDPDRNEVSSTISLTVSAMGNGHYRAQYTPDKKGMWYMALYHSVHFPWGKTGETQVYDNDFDTIGVDLARALGLMQENYFLDQTQWNADGYMTSGRIRLYSDSASVGTSSNIIATYRVTATYDGTSSYMLNYKVTKI